MIPDIEFDEGQRVELWQILRKGFSVVSILCSHWCSLKETEISNQSLAQSR